MVLDFNTAENITETLVSEGLVVVRREGNRNNPEIIRLCEIEEVAKAAGKGKWGSNLQVIFYFIYYKKRFILILFVYLKYIPNLNCY